MIVLFLAVLAYSDADYSSPGQQEKIPALPFFKSHQRKDSLPFQFGMLKQLLMNRKKRKMVDDIALPYYLLNAMFSEIEKKERADSKSLHRNAIPFSLYRSDNRMKGTESNEKRKADSARSLVSDGIPLSLYRSDSRRERFPN